MADDTRTEDQKANDDRYDAEREKRTRDAEREAGR